MDDLGLKGAVKVIIRDANGNIKWSYENHNVITNVGKARVAGLIGGLNSSAFTYVAIGTGTTAPSAGDTALGNEVKRKQGTASQVTTDVTNDTLKVEATFSSSDGLSGTANITEAGLFDASTGGNMLSRASVSNASVDWDAGDTLTITWKIQVQ